MSVRLRGGASETVELSWWWEPQRSTRGPDAGDHAGRKRRWLDREEACAVVRRLGAGTDRIGPLRRFAAEAVHAPLGRKGDTALLDQLARWIAGGKVRVAVEHHGVVVRGVGEAIGEEGTPAFAPRVLKHREPTLAEPALLEEGEGTFPLDLDVAAIVAAQKEAARFGVPFCEECRKPAEKEEATFPLDLDVAAIVDAQKEAARFGVPFCEECRK